MSCKRIGQRAGVLAVALVAVFATAAAASVRVPLSGWYWGNPAPQGNSLEGGRLHRRPRLRGRRRRHGAAQRRRRQGLGGPRDRHRRRPRPGCRSSIPRPSSSSAAAAASCGAPMTAARRSTRSSSSPRSNCPDRVQARATFVDADDGYLLLADGSVLQARPTPAQSFSKQTAIPGTAGRARRPAARPPRTSSFSGADSGDRVRLVDRRGRRASRTSTTDAGVSWKPLTHPGRQHRHASTASTRPRSTRIGTETLLRSTDGGATFTKQAVRRRPDADLDRLRRRRPLPASRPHRAS